MDIAILAVGLVGQRLWSQRFTYCSADVGAIVRSCWLCRPTDSGEGYRNLKWMRVRNMAAKSGCLAHFRFWMSVGREQ